MTTHTPAARGATVSGATTTVRTGWPYRAASESPATLGFVEPLAVPAVAESAEAMVEDLDAPLAAAPALLDRFWAAVPDEADRSNRSSARAGHRPDVVSVWRDQDARSFAEDTLADDLAPQHRSIPVDEYAKAVLYNGLGHYHAAHAAAQRACARDDFALLDGALSELVEASIRSGHRRGAAAALGRLEERARLTRSPWVVGVAACSRALLDDDAVAEGDYREAIDRLAGIHAQVALARARLLYGEWLRRRGRRVDARGQLAVAQRTFNEVGLSGFADRARRELLATVHTARKRIDSTRLDLTPQESQIAQLAAVGWTNPEIGERLFISPRTVEWHLRKVFTKLGVSSRRELNKILPQGAPFAALA
jgi:DNA-binding CsgD family transcriptional regulator